MTVPARKLKVTEWFDGQTMPVHIGLYEIDVHGTQMWSYWNGQQFGWRCRRQEEAYKFGDNRAIIPVVKWRGLTKGSAALLEIRGILWRKK